MQALESQRFRLITVKMTFILYSYGFKLVMQGVF